MADDRGRVWAEAFEQGWQLTDREAWFRHFEAMLAVDVRLLQPMLPEARGRGALRQTFEPVFAFLPDVTASLTSWAARGDELFLAFTMSGTLRDGEQLSWRVVDRLELDAEGLATLREAFFDPTPLMQAAQKAYSPDDVGAE